MKLHLLVSFSLVSLMLLPGCANTSDGVTRVVEPQTPRNIYPTQAQQENYVNPSVQAAKMISPITQY